MKVEIWSDYACPFCYIGKKKFETALERFAHKDQIETEYRSFELNPSADPNAHISTYSMLASKYGMSIDQAKATTVNVAEQAAAVGLTFNFENMVETNTFDAHRLVLFANGHGKAKEMSERLFKAHFTDNDNVGNCGTLSQLAAEVGLDKDLVAEMLATSSYSDEVRAQEEEGSRLGIRGVPFYVFDRKYAVSGAQSPEVFLDTLNKAWEDKYPAFVQVNEGDDDGLCTDGSCAINEPKS
jgi:predicted DsbA family dithiol-disulfide isomerase